jgi:hypothetical protein
VELKYVSGAYGGSVKPSPFLCLVLKLLQLQPELDIVLEYIKNEDFRYVILNIVSPKMHSNRENDFLLFFF